MAQDLAFSASPIITDKFGFEPNELYVELSRMVNAGNWVKAVKN